MSADPALPAAGTPRTNAAITAAVAAACARVAPAWPLDRLIAVNPYWGFVEQRIDGAAARLASLSGATLLMPRRWYRSRRDAGAVHRAHIERAQALLGDERPANEILDALQRDETAPHVMRLVTDVLDHDRDLAHEPSWSDYVVRHVSQAAAAWFDDGQARWVGARAQGLYPFFRELAEDDRGPRLLMGLRDFGAAAEALPAEPLALITLATTELGVAPGDQADYFSALLLSVNGWASACAFRRWEARLTGGDDDAIVHLLAVRLAWELLLHRAYRSANLEQRWRAAQGDWPQLPAGAAAARRDDWIVQRALELAYHERLAGSLHGAQPAAHRVTSPSAQLVFCIDVRSEVMRRALEAAAPNVQTLGFAGFFGLPIAYRPLSGPDRPQLPGLLAPALVARDAGLDRDAATASAVAQLALASDLKELSVTAGSAFSFVESAGLGWLAALVRDSFARGGEGGDPLRPAVPPGSSPLRVELAGRAADDGAPDLAARVDLAAGILRAMSLTSGFAPILALVGHGAACTNNPQAAGLHCGACGGQTGEVNARALATLLNAPEIRRGLLDRGIDLADTHVVGALHDTTTDDLTLFDRDLVPASHRRALAQLEADLARASDGARAERAPSLGLGHLSGEALTRAIRTRARDWSEVRPEWGLAGNAAFVVAPRERTRGLDLAGRSFLHEYRWEQDAGFGVLEAIMTAPMVVTHWINMQYHASTTDNPRYGSGNKTLHNVVGGHVGVMEGAGGDLRIGLALQSVHDGSDWRHEPVRLGVYIEAPADAIDQVLAKHALVRALVEGEWLFLHRIDPSSGAVTLRTSRGWQPVAASPAGVPTAATAATAASRAHGGVPMR